MQSLPLKEEPKHLTYKLESPIQTYKKKKNMDVEKVFHMNGGVGKTSYAKNSSLQKKASDKVKHIIIQSVEELYLATTPKSIGIADLGCSSGPNTLSIIRDIFQAIEGVCNKIMMMKHPSEFRVYLNDLPTNDFNSIFQALPEFHRLLRQDKNNNNNGFPSIFMGAYPGSFYGRLFPNSSLHFVHSSYSLHWLSRVPPALYDGQGRPLNKGCVYISESSPEVVTQAYLEQFKEDFSLFLRSRSEELVVDGRMVLIFLGRRGQQHLDRGNSFFWHILSRSFHILVSQGEIEQEKLDSYDVHFYAPSKEEIEAEVRKEGSLKLERLEMFEMDTIHHGTAESYGTAVAMAVRAIQESMISNHFGEKILDSLFENYAGLVDEEMAKEDIKPITFVLVLRKM